MVWSSGKKSVLDLQIWELRNSQCWYHAHPCRETEARSEPLGFSTVSYRTGEGKQAQVVNRRYSIVRGRPVSQEGRCDNHPKQERQLAMGKDSSGGRAGHTAACGVPN